jgi:hypothetical protein
MKVRETWALNFSKVTLTLQHDTVEYAICVLTFRRPLINALTMEAVCTFEKAEYIDYTESYLIESYLII